jgi:hypothetical protein
VLIIYLRLSDELNPEKGKLLAQTAFSPRGFGCLIACVLLMPVNWGIESYKWRIITAPVEPISFGRANRSIYSGICLGNFAPGRATEFIAKILFFEPDNRPKVTVLHFMNGMFQFSVTVIIGFAALLLKLRDFGSEYAWMVYVSGGIGVLMLAALSASIYKVEFLLRFITKKVGNSADVEGFQYNFPMSRVVVLFVLSAIRYTVFFSQFALVLYIFNGEGLFLPVLSGISVYFLITATIPMLSVAEAAIRAAVAMVVFKSSGMSDTVVALTTVLIWLINIIIPSLIGYYFLLRENFNFKVSLKRK